MADAESQRLQYQIKYLSELINNATKKASQLVENSSHSNLNETNVNKTVYRCLKYPDCSDMLGFSSRPYTCVSLKSSPLKISSNNEEQNLSLGPVHQHQKIIASIKHVHPERFISKKDATLKSAVKVKENPNTPGLLHSIHVGKFNKLISEKADDHQWQEMGANIRKLSVSKVCTQSLPEPGFSNKMKSHSEITLPCPFSSVNNQEKAKKKSSSMNDSRKATLKLSKNSDQLMAKQAELLLARKQMESKLENVKASLLRMTACKKKQHKRQLIQSSEKQGLQSPLVAKSPHIAVIKKESIQGANSSAECITDTVAATKVIIYPVGEIKDQSSSVGSKKPRTRNVQDVLLEQMKKSQLGSGNHDQIQVDNRVKEKVKSASITNHALQLYGKEKNDLIDSAECKSVDRAFECHAPKTRSHLANEFNSCGSKHRDTHFSLFVKNGQDSISMDSNIQVDQSTKPRATVDSETITPLPCFSNVHQDADVTGVTDKVTLQKLVQSKVICRLKDELQTTEDKLQQMRKKIGYMLKESPARTADSVKDHSGFSSSELFIRGIGTLARKKIKQRPFTHRKSLRWTPNKTAISDSAKEPTSLSALSAAPSPPLTTLSEKVGRCKVPVKLEQADMDTLLLKRSLYKLVRKPGSFSAKSSASILAKPSHASKYHLQKYKMDKTCLNGGLLQANYEMSVHPEVSPAESNWHQSRLQRAAKTVISKYKMQRVPVADSGYKMLNKTPQVPFSHIYRNSPHLWLKKTGAKILNRKRNSPLHEHVIRVGTVWAGRFSYLNGHYQNNWLSSSRLAGYWNKRRFYNQKLEAKGRHRQQQFYNTKPFHYAGLRLNRNKPNVSHSLKLSPFGNKNKQVRFLNGVMYRSSSTRLRRTQASVSPAVKSKSSHRINTTLVTGAEKKRLQMVSVHGIQYRVDRHGKWLQRISNVSSVSHSKAGVCSTSNIQTQLDALEKVQTRMIVNRVKQRSLAVVTAKFRKVNRRREKRKFCIFFCRFGKCSRGDQCQYVHDPEKVAVCTRFLRGTCKLEKCPFSHKIAKEKMPVCAFFLRGVCGREDCPYLHVKVNHGADVCQDFVNGFCAMADKCKKLHTLTCPVFAKTGSCPEGAKCRLKHLRDTGQSRISSKENTKRIHLEPKPTVKVDKTDRKRLLKESSDVEQQTEDDQNLSTPKKLARLPAYISLTDYSFDESPVHSQSPDGQQSVFIKTDGLLLQIKPRL